MFKEWLQAVFGDTVLKAKRQQVALLLARNYLHQRAGVNALHPDLQLKIRLIQEEMEDMGKPMYLFEGFRSWSRQDELYNKVPKVTNARGGQSYHQYGLAADMIFTQYKWNPPSESWWDDFGKVARKNGLEWGGDWEGFRDRPHVELPYTTWQELRPYFNE